MRSAVLLKHTVHRVPCLWAQADRSPLHLRIQPVHHLDRVVLLGILPEADHAVLLVDLSEYVPVLNLHNYKGLERLTMRVVSIMAKSADLFLNDAYSHTLYRMRLAYSKGWPIREFERPKSWTEGPKF
jgi:hypothetical protein